MFHKIAAKDEKLGELVLLSDAVIHSSQACDALFYTKLYPKNTSSYNWFRLGKDAYAVIEALETIEKDMGLFKDEMKYVVFANKDNLDERYMFVFTKNINHSDIAEMIQEQFYENDMATVEPSSAGFVNTLGVSGGSSETLSLASDKRDSGLFKKTFGAVHEQV